MTRPVGLRWPLNRADPVRRWIVLYRAAPGAAQSEEKHPTAPAAFARFDELRAMVLRNERGDVQLLAIRDFGEWPLGRLSRGMAPRMTD